MFDAFALAFALVAGDPSPPAAPRPSPAPATRRLCAPKGRCAGDCLVDHCECNTGGRYDCYVCRLGGDRDPHRPKPETPVMAWYDSGTYPGQQVYGYVRPDGMIQPATPLRMRPKAGYTVPAPTVPRPPARPASVPWYPARSACPNGRCPR